jgi:hypothetical protein
MPIWAPGDYIDDSDLQAATPWVLLSTLGTFPSGSSADATVPAMARDVFVRDEVLRQFKGIINLTGVGTTGFTFFTFSSAYLPDYERHWGAAGLGINTPFRVFLSTAGNWGMTGQSAGVTSLRLDQFDIKSAGGRISA